MIYKISEIDDAKKTKDLYYNAMMKGFEPEPVVTVAEWADRYRFLSQKSSSEHGKWKTSRTPYLREIMNNLSASSEAKRIVFMKGSQVGGTEAGQCWIGYIIHMSPGPILFVEPTVESAKKVSKQRIMPTIDETPVLQERIKPCRERDSGNTLFTKEFQNGVLMMTGANSAVGLRSMPIRFLFLDEVDGYPSDLEGEGDPVSIAEKRTATFSRSKIFLVSTPKMKGLSRIEKEFIQSDQRYYYMPCPFCKEMLKFKWANIEFKHNDYRLQGNVRHACEKCGALIDEHHKTQMLAKGEWVAENKNGSCCGYHLSALYSPVGWRSWNNIVQEFLNAKKTNDTALLKTWVNTVLGETWEEQGVSVDTESIYDRRENYTDILPDEIAILTAGVDVQDNRLELEIKGWGRDEESWGIDYVTIPYSPADPECWDRLDEILGREYTHEFGFKLKTLCTAIDSAGHFTKEVYAYVKRREYQRVFATKGSNIPGSPLISRPRTSNRGKVKLFMVGTEAGKETLFTRLNKKDAGAGYMHYNKKFDLAYFKQFQAEKLITEYNKGIPRHVWKQVAARNEAIDINVLNIVALGLINVDLNKIVDTMQSEEGYHVSGINQQSQAGAKTRRVLSSGIQ